MKYVLGFAGAGAIIVLASLVLAHTADGLAAATRVGRLWIGTVVLAGATSLPELTTGIAAVRLDATNLAAGELFGSSMANMLILAVVDLLARRREVIRTADRGHALGASLAIALNAFAAVLLLVRPRASVLAIDPGSIILVSAYLLGTRVMYRQSQVEPTPAAPRPRSSASLRTLVLVFAVAAAVVLVTAPTFAWSAKGLAATTGLGDTFVGTWFVGLATSLPELATCLAAAKIGAHDLAVGNLFGSNAFNMVILLALDAAQPGSLYVALAPDHAITSLLAIILMSLGIAAIMARGRRRLSLTEPSSLLMIITYAYGIWLLYRHAAS